MVASGLTFDLVRRILYVADQHRHTIECMDYEGTDMHTVVSGEVRLRH